MSTPLSTVTLKWSIGDTFSSKHWYQFDVTEAVQGWVQDTCDPNKGFLFKVADSVENGSEIQNRTFGSYNRSDYRPSLTVTYIYEENKLTVREGQTCTLPTDGLSGTATWASSNTTAATVNASGEVTGLKAGNTTVTATVNGTVEREFQICVAIADGVYYLENCNSGYYLSVKDSDVLSGSVATQESKRQTAPEKYSQLWKITYLANGMYSVRPMHRLNMGLSIYEDAASIWEIGVEDTITKVSEDCQWTIIYSAYGYVLRNKGDVAKTLVPTNRSTAKDATITADSPRNPVLSYIWVLDKVPVSNHVIFYDREKKELTLNPVRYVAPEETRSQAGLKLYASFVSQSTNDQNIQWSIGGFPPGTVNNYMDATVDQHTGSVTGVIPNGYTTVKASVVSDNGIPCEETYALHVTAIPEGTYYVRNRSTEKYAATEETSMYNGKPVQQRAFVGGITQSWLINHLGDGAYSVSPNYSYYLGVPQDSTVTGTGLRLRTGLLDNGTRWLIQTTGSDAYKFIPEAGESLGLALAINYSTPSADGAVLQQQLYTNDADYKDEWVLHRHLDYTLMYIGNYDGDPRMPSRIASAQNAFAEYTDFTGYGKTSMTKVELCEHLTSSQYFACITHGLIDRLTVSDGQLTKTDLESIPYSSFANLRFAYLGACETAQIKEETKNLVDFLHEDKGIDIVVGFRHDVYQEEAFVWSEAFMESLIAGKTVAAAMEDADAALEDAFPGRQKIYRDDGTGNKLECTFSVSALYRYVAGDANIAPFA